MLLLIAGTPASAQVAPVPASGFTTDGLVTSLLAGPGNVMYLGGTFSSVAKRTGHWVRFDASGARDAAWPEVDGSVRAVVPDGGGGWFIGGAFTHVAGQRRVGLAHVGSAGELDLNWSPDVDLSNWDPGFGGVMALSVVGDTVYVGGRFEEIDGQPRSHLAAVDAVSGQVRTWAPRLDGSEVTALAATAGTVYVAGDFTSVGSARREHLTAFDTAGGRLNAWNPDVTGQDFPGEPLAVQRLLIDRGTLYVTGQFDAVAGQVRPGIAAFDATTGELSPWNPREIDRLMNEVEAITAAGDTVYVSVSFGFTGERCGSFDGRHPMYLVALAATTRADVRWCSELSPILALAAAGDRVYAGGGYDSVAGPNRRFLRVVSATTGVLGSWNPRPDGEVSSLVATDDGVLAGGLFSGLDSETRTNGAAIDLDTGALLAFAPDLTDNWDLGPIDAMATHHDRLFAAGDFVEIGGRHRHGLAELDATTGRARRWNAHVSPTGRPRALAVHGRRLFVGGDFRRIGGRPRRGLAALDVRTGSATRWHADTNGAVNTLAIKANTLYVAGNFTRVGGQRRRHLAAIDLRTGRVTAWHPNPDGRVRAIALTVRTVYLGGDFRHVGGKSRAHLAAVDASSGKVESWRAGADAPVHALAVLDGTIYVGGAFRTIAGAARHHIAALDAESGAPTPWDPGADGVVTALLTMPAGLVAAGSFTSLGGTGQTGLGIFPAASTAAASTGHRP
ncbi:PQQ-binding-like beta-propeller repeat protein [Solirubrobacter soli]|uniref:PQQ-binding-like beta-propeller repeat protein n=1 Tax=Solirubrobacter soli TaxID=363832 RepID=UPI0012F99697|nr:PQQ-binding-like beta-propeller repeat protein [Solirubrobacter soli]